MAEKKDDNKIYNSKILHEEFNEERERKGQFTMPQSNGIVRISGKDKSWSSLPDFFIKLFKKDR